MIKVGDTIINQEGQVCIVELFIDYDDEQTTDGTNARVAIAKVEDGLYYCVLIEALEQRKPN